MRRSKLAIAVAMSVMACGVCQSVWADNQENTLQLNGVTGNGSMENVNGVYGFYNENEERFEKIQWSDGNSANYFLLISESDNNKTYDILTNTLELKSESGLSHVIYNEQAENVQINLGKKHDEINKIDILTGPNGSAFSKIVFGGDNSSINIYAKDMKMDTTYYPANDPTMKEHHWAIVSGHYSKNSSININVSNSLYLKGDIGNGLYSDYSSDQLAGIGSNNSKININQDSEYTGTVKIDGDLYCYNRSPIGWYNKNNSIKINFLGNDSVLTGKALDLWDNKRDLNSYDSNNVGIHLNFKDGAIWNVSEVSQLVELNATNKSVLDLTYGDQDVFKGIIVLKDFNGDGAVVKMKIDGTIDPNSTTDNCDQLLIYGNHTGTTQIDITNIGSDYSKAVGTILAQVGTEQGKFTAKDVEGALTWVKYEVNEEKQTDNSSNWVISKAETVTSSNPTTSVRTLLSTITAGYDTWRNDTDKFNERMGELRMNGAGNEGVWVRTKGSEFGRHSSNGSYTNKQQTYQLGYDAVTSKDEKQTTYTGVAAEYGKGSLTFDSGTGTMKSLGLGVYQSQLRDSGHYLDLTYRFDKYKNDFHVADSMGNPISGKYGNNAMSLSAEYGRKNALKHGWYVEPQSEVTLGYMFGNDFTTSNNIRVEQKNMPALIGRLGLNIGREVSDKVNFYVKASVNHDFLGNYDMHMTDMSTGERLNASDKFGSSWFDYGAGLSVKTGKDSYAYFDIERAVGGEYKKNWDWNAGVRWSF